MKKCFFQVVRLLAFGLLAGLALDLFGDVLRRENRITELLVLEVLLGLGAAGVVPSVPTTGFAAIGRFDDGFEHHLLDLLASAAGFANHHDLASVSADLAGHIGRDFGIGFQFGTLGQVMMMASITAAGLARDDDFAAGVAGVARLNHPLLLEQELLASSRAGKADVLDLGADAEKAFLRRTHLAFDFRLQQDVSGLEQIAFGRLAVRIVEQPEKILDNHFPGYRVSGETQRLKTIERFDLYYIFQLRHNCPPHSKWFKKFGIELLFNN